MEETRHEYEIPGMCEQFMGEVWNYLSSKFPEMENHDVQDISAYIGNRFGIAIQDIIVARDKEWQKEMNRTCNYWEKRYSKLITDYDELNRKLIKERNK